jgi:hypothetical protein
VGNPLSLELADMAIDRGNKKFNAKNSYLITEAFWKNLNTFMDARP